MTDRFDVWQENIYRLKVPLPFPLRWINSYIVRENDGLSIIDPGLKTAESIAAWTRFFHETDTAVRDVKQVILTHHHPDHIGLAGWMQEQSGATVLIHPDGMQQAHDLWGDGRPVMDKRILELFTKHGLDRERLEQMEKHFDSFIGLVSPLPNAEQLHAGDTVILGGHSFEAILTPGHAYGHLSLYSKENGVIFCGDHVLPRITPNVSYIPGVDENPLASYLGSLKQMLKYDVKVAYPGHRDPFENYAQRIQEILQHHEQRLDELCAWTREPQSTVALCERMFGNRLSIHQMRFALSEVIAHLIYLEGLHKVSQRVENDVVHWQAID